MPALEARLDLAPGKTYGVNVPIAPRVLSQLGVEGALVRGEQRRPLAALQAALDADVRLARRRTAGRRRRTRGTPSWSAAGCATFGPGTEADIVWWLGATKTAVRARARRRSARSRCRWTAAAPAGCCPTTSTRRSDGRAVGGAAAGARPDGDGLEGARLLPRRRTRPHLFDTNGNAGTTAWWDGRVVGCWVQDDAGVVEVRLLEKLPDGRARRARGGGRAADRLAGRRPGRHRLPFVGDEGRRLGQPVTAVQGAARAAGAAGAAAADPLRQARPAPVHQPPRLQPGLRAGGVPGPAADGVLLGVQPAPADLVRRGRADRLGERGGVPRAGPGRGRSTRRRSTPRWTRRCPTGSTSSRWSRRPAGRWPTCCEASRWRIDAPGRRSRTAEAAVAAFLAAEEVLVQRMTKKGMRDFDSRAAVLSLVVDRPGTAGAVPGPGAAPPRSRRCAPTTCCRADRASPGSSLAAYRCSPGWPRVRSTRPPARSATRCGLEMSCRNAAAVRYSPTVDDTRSTTRRRSRSENPSRMPDRDAARQVGDSDRSSRARRPRQATDGLRLRHREGVAAMKA